MDTRKLNPLFFAGPNQISIPNRYLGCGCKGLVFGRNNGCTKMGVDSWAENTPNTPEFICPICLPKPKNSGFQ